LAKFASKRCFNFPPFQIFLENTCHLLPVGGIYQQMQESDDITLLRKYVEDESEEAFAALVARHIHKVYSVALRHTGNPSQAEEITQAVFVILARKSASLAVGWRRRLAAVVRLPGDGGNMATSLSGWLYQTARLTAVTFVRSAIRRTRREQEAYMQSVLTESEP